MTTTVLFFFEKDFTREIGGHKSKCSWRAFATCCCSPVHIVACSRRALNVRWMLIDWLQKPTWLGDRQTMTFVLWQMASSITSYWMHTAFFNHEVIYDNIVIVKSEWRKNCLFCRDIIKSSFYIFSCLKSFCYSI